MNFTPREKTVIPLLALTNKQIARQLSLKESTIEKYVESIRDKFNANTRTRAAILALGLRYDMLIPELDREIE